MVPAESPMSRDEFQFYNRMAEKMDGLHEHFRQQWGVMHAAARNSSRPDGMSLRTFLQFCLGFCEKLIKHHTIEETRVFPVLATRMPAFRPTSHMMAQHEAIHSGLNDLGIYCQGCLRGINDFQWKAFRDILLKFGPVLWEHLDTEVHELGAHQIRKYWSKDEVLRMLM